MHKLNEIAEKADEAIFSSNQEAIEQLIHTLEKTLDSTIPSDLECYTRYILGNLYHGMSAITAENTSGWRNNSYPDNLTAEINHLRQAKSLLSDQTSAIKKEVETNLTNAVSQQRRNIEVLSDWHHDFSTASDVPYVSSLSKARELIWVSQWLNDPNHQNLYRYEAYRLLSTLKKNIEKTDHPKIKETLDTDPQIMSILEKGENFFNGLENWQSSYDDTQYELDEKEYRRWCLQNRLFANPINDLTTEWIADQDILQFPNHTVNAGDGPYFPAAFSALKREFCFARFMAFEGINGIHPEYENKKLFLTDTLDYVHYDGAIEKIKTAYRICFSVFDSIAFLMNFYFQCNSKHIAFSSRWIKDNFKNKDINYFIDALYWLACDLTDNPDVTNNPEKWKAPNPHAAEFRKIRNAIEHGWLRVAEQDSRVWGKDSDFSYRITPQLMQERTLEVLKLARSAMLYLCMAVSYNEFQNKKSEDLVATSPIFLVEDEFISL